MSDFEPRSEAAPPEAAPTAVTAPAPDPKTGLLVDPRTLVAFLDAEASIARARLLAEHVPREAGDERMESAIADALQTIKHARTDTIAALKIEKRPYVNTGKRIEASFRELLSPLLAIEEELKERLVVRQAKLKQEADEERRREERNARERQAREDAKSAETGVAGKHHAPPPPKKVATGARGQSGAKSSVKMVTKYEVTDVNKLPEGYWERKPLNAQIKAAVQQGLVLEGVRVWQEPVVATR